MAERVAARSVVLGVRMLGLSLITEQMTSPEVLRPASV
jgi:hypothetical protein